MDVPELVGTRVERWRALGEARGITVTVDVPDGTDVVWLEEPLLGQVRAVAEPFHRRGRGR